MNKFRLQLFIALIWVFLPVSGVMAKSSNDPWLATQSYLEQINAKAAWDVFTGSDDVIVAVIDSGVAIEHPDLVENIWINSDEIPGDGKDNDNNGYVDDTNGWDYVQNDNDPRPAVKFPRPGLDVMSVSHGTIVAGIIGAQGDNGIGMAGINWNVKIMPLRVLNQYGSGSMADVVKAIDYAVEKGADVINISITGVGRNPLLDDAIYRAYAFGSIVVAPAGNQFSGDVYDLDELSVLPICTDANSGNRNLVVGVAATDFNNKKAYFSNYGSNCVDISAPGVGMYSTIYKDEELGFFEYYSGPFSGTSLSAPVVSGAFALLKAYNPNLTNEQIINVVLDSATNIYGSNPEFTNNELGQGGLDLLAAIKLAQSRYGLPDFTGRPAKKPKVLLSVGAKSTYTSDVKIFSLYNKFAKEELILNTFPYRFKGGVNVLPIDLNTFVAVPGEGGGPQVIYFNAKGEIFSSFFVYDKDFRGGLSIARGHVLNSFEEHLVIGLGTGAEPKVLIVDDNGNVLKEWLAYGANYNKGVNVALADLNGDGIEEIVTGTKTGGGPQVRVFNADGRALMQWFAYAEHFRGGVNVTGGDLDGDGIDEIITGPYSHGGPHVRIFNNRGKFKSHFFAYNKNLRSGLSVLGVDIDQNGTDEIIVGIDDTIIPHINVYSSQGLHRFSLQAFTEEDFPGGITINSSQ